MTDKFHQHEALDRCHLIIEIIEVNLLQHPYIEEDSELFSQVEEAQKILCKVYQQIGAQKRGR